MTTPPTESSFPFRYRESTFRNYEAAIRQIVEAYPKAVTFTPRSVETFSCRLRDSMKSLFIYGWQTNVDTEKFGRCHDGIVVAIRDHEVIAGSLKAIREAKPSTDQPPKGFTIEKVFETLTDPAPDLLEATLVLHHYRLKVNPTTVKFTTHRDLRSEGHEMRYDVAIEQKEDGSFLIL